MLIEEELKEPERCAITQWGGLGRYWWPAVGPRPRRLKLCRKAEEGCFVTEAPDEVSAHRQAVGIPEERY